MKFLNVFFEFIAWLRIFLFPFLILGFTGYIVAHHYSGMTAKLILLAGLLLGITTGALLAEKIRRRASCSDLIDRMSSSADIDDTISSHDLDTPQ